MNYFRGISLLHILVISCVYFVKDVESARLAITPSANVPAGSTAVTLSCTAAPDIYTEIYDLTILKENIGVTGTILAKINQGGSTPSTSRLAITGNYAFESPSTSFLQVVISNPVCSDAGSYQCKSVGVGTTGELTEDKNMTIRSDPGTITKTVRPDKSVFGYDVNDTMDIQCGGRVGNPQKYWSWQWKRAGSTFWNSFSNNDDITEGPVRPPTATDCSYDSSSVLKYVVKADDNGMMIRCQVDNNEAYSENYTIKVKGAPATEGPNTDAVSAAGLEGGAIAGIAIGIILLIVIIIIVVIIVIKKRKSGAGKEYNTRENDKESRGAPISTIPRDNEMKHDNDRGHTNKTLDEPHETSRKAYDDYNNGGRRNPAMDDSTSDVDEHDRRDPYLAQDGTDIRGSNAMLGSTV